MHTTRPRLLSLLFGLQILLTNINSNRRPAIAILSIHYQDRNKKICSGKIFFDWSKADELKFGERLHIKQKDLMSSYTGYLHIDIGIAVFKIGNHQE